MITRQSVQTEMTRQERALSRLKTAYALNHIPVPPKTEKQLKRLPSPRLEALADHWEQRYQEGLSDRDDEGETEPEEPNILHPSCPIFVMARVIRRMAGFNGRKAVPAAAHDSAYHGW